LGPDASIHSQLHVERLRHPGFHWNRLPEIIRLELDAVGAPKDRQLTLSGSSVFLEFDVAMAVGFAVHELASNAMKHGALSNTQGSLTVSWKVIQDPEHESVLHLNWKEAGVSIARVPDKTLKREVISRVIGSSLQVKSETSFTADGLICQIEAPVASMKTCLPRDL
jgi:two-component system, chemotaxis family, CheB/CheR fusion protein